MVIEFCHTDVTDGAVFGPEWLFDEAGGAEDPVVEPVPGLCQLHDGPVPLVVRDNNTTCIAAPSLEKVVP